MLNHGQNMHWVWEASHMNNKPLCRNLQLFIWCFSSDILNGKITDKYKLIRTPQKYEQDNMDKFVHGRMATLISQDVRFCQKCKCEMMTLPLPQEMCGGGAAIWKNNGFSNSPIFKTQLLSKTGHWNFDPSYLSQLHFGMTSLLLAKLISSAVCAGLMVWHHYCIEGLNRTSFCGGSTILGRCPNPCHRYRHWRNSMSTTSLNLTPFRFRCFHQYCLLCELILVQSSAKKNQAQLLQSKEKKELKHNKKYQRIFNCVEPLHR